MKTTVAFILVLSIGLLAQTPAAVPPQAPVNPQIKQAQQLNSEGKQDEALVILNKLSRANPTVTRPT